MFNDDNFEVFDSYWINPEQLFRSYHLCRYQQVVPVIAADCNVYSCHNTAYTDYGLIGSIRDQSFRELWFSKAVRQRFATFDPTCHCQGIQCANDTKNKILDEAINSYGDNFV
jgi:radical SAM protein with 4Fe4S-binding SPASM domain